MASASNDAGGDERVHRRSICSFQRRLAADDLRLVSGALGWMIAYFMVLLALLCPLKAGQDHRMFWIDRMRMKELFIQ